MQIRHNLPRGGGAFIAEVDGNLTLNKGETVKLHWQGKHRGPDFDPIHFELKTVTAPSLVEWQGRPVPTVMAEALTKGESVKRADKARGDDDEVLLPRLNAARALACRDGGNAYVGARQPASRTRTAFVMRRTGFIRESLSTSRARAGNSPSAGMRPLLRRAPTSTAPSRQRAYLQASLAKRDG